MWEKRQFNFAKRWAQSDPVTAHALQLQRQLTMGMSGGVVLLLLMSAPWLWSYKLQYDVNLVNRQIAAMADVNAIVQKLKQVKSQLDDQKKVLSLAQAQMNDPLPLLEKLRSILPPGTTISTFSLKDQNVTLQVVSPLPVDVARLWVSLRDAQLFRTVDIQTVSLSDKSQTLNLNLSLIKPISSISSAGHNPSVGSLQPTGGE